MPNEEIMRLVADALREYPLSQPQDIVKLLYQREFGPAHAIPSPEAARRFLWEEYSATPQESGPLFEYIGSGYARLRLSALDANGVTPDEAAEVFFKSAVPAGDRSDFVRMLRGLAADERVFRLMPALPGFIAGYIEAGCPALHHSAQYRAAYRPAYRVVRPELLSEKI